MRGQHENASPVVATLAFFRLVAIGPKSFQRKLLYASPSMLSIRAAAVAEGLRRCVISGSAAWCGASRSLTLGPIAPVTRAGLLLHSEPSRTRPGRPVDQSDPERLAGRPDPRRTRSSCGPLHYGWHEGRASRRGGFRGCRAAAAGILLTPRAVVRSCGVARAP